MKRSLLPSFALVTSLLGASLGASADVTTTTTTYNFEDNNAVFTARNHMSVGIENDATLNSNVVAFTNDGQCQNSYAFANYDFSDLVKKASKVTLTFDYYNLSGGRGSLTIGDADMRGTTGNITKKVTYSSTGAIIRLGSDKNNFLINSSQLTKGEFCSQWLKVSVAVDLDAQSVTYSIKTQAGEELASGTTAYYDTSAKSCSQIDIFGWINSSKSVLLDNISIAVDVDNSKTYTSYAVKFVDASGNEIKTAETESDVEAGTKIDELPSKYTQAIYDANGKKYIFDSYEVSTTDGVAADGTTVVTAKFREAKTFAYTVNCIAGNTTKTITGSGVEGEAVTQGYPAYLVDNGTLYTSSKLSSDGKGYYLNLTMTADNLVRTINYTASDTKNIVYSSEGEDIAGMTKSNAANSAVRSSNGKAAYAPADITIATLPAGTYKIYAVVFNGQNSQITWNFNAGETTVFALQGGKQSNWTSGTSDEFTLTSNTDIVIPKTGGNNAALDYVYIQKTADAAVPAANYATYVTLDNVKVPENIKVYGAKYADGSIKACDIAAGTILAPGTAIIINAGEGTTYSFETSTETAAEIADNALQASTGSGLKADGTQYCLTNQNGVIGFRQVKSGVVIPVGKAYLTIANPAVSTASEFIPLDLVITGIDGIDAEPAATAEAAPAEYYTLDGVKVAQPQKGGIYIANGKVIVVK